MIKFTLLFAYIILLALHSTQAFCVYSFLDEGAPAIRISNFQRFRKKSFEATLKPGENACCHWSNGDCNPSGQQNGEVAFKLTDWFDISESNSNPGTTTVRCEGGGSLAFRGSSLDDFRFVCTQVDGTEVFSYVKDLNRQK